MSKEPVIKKIRKYREMDELEKGIKFALNALKKEQDLREKAKINIQLGRLYDQHATWQEKKVKKNLYDKAIESFKKALKFYEASALKGIATVYHHQVKMKKALEFYKKAYKKDPSKTAAFYNDLGNVYQRIGLKLKGGDKIYLRKAEGYYKKALRHTSVSKEKISPFFNLAILLDNLGEEKSSRHYAKKALMLLKKDKPSVKRDRFIEFMEKIIQKKRQK